MQHNIFERLTEHTLPIDTSYWAEMEERLQRRPRKTRAFLLWFSSTGIAASFALLLFMRISNGDNTHTEQNFANDKTIQQTQNESVTIELSIPQKLDLKIQKTEYHYPTISVQGQTYVTGDHFKKTSDTETETTTETPDIVQIEHNIISEKQEVAPFKHNNEIVANYSLTLNKEKIHDNNSWIIAAVVSASNSNYSSNNDLASLAGNDKDYAFENTPNGSISGDRNNSSSNGDKINSILPDQYDPSIDDIFRQFPEVTHAPPLSVGLNIRKKINKHLALETGLTYTFLQSKFKDNNEWQPRTATLKLHYIGVPLNIVVYILNKPQWNVYTSVGGMVEKGLRLDYNQTTVTRQWYGGDKIFHNQSLQDNIPGVQWSLNTAFGIDYTIYRNIGLYFEPRIIYYFKNNQPVSVRSETPLSVGLNAGVRFEF
ncbi:MAG: PorT family protein [Bacteroidetes bacterium]|nr:PorT family protein [Bacteroidota bacterium]